MAAGTMVLVADRQDVPPFPVRLMAPGTALVPQPREIFGHAAESRRRHVLELVGKFEVRLVVETDGARVFQCGRSAPRAEIGMRAAGVEPADRRREAMLAVV